MFSELYYWMYITLRKIKTNDTPAFNASNGLLLNNATVATSFTVPTGSNASSVGPITLNSGVTVTVSSGQRWVVQ